jgi:hypothetical protein
VAKAGVGSELIIIKRFKILIVVLKYNIFSQTLVPIYKKTNKGDCAMEKLALALAFVCITLLFSSCSSFGDNGGTTNPGEHRSFFPTRG